MALAAAGTAVVVTGTAVVGMALVRAGIPLAVAGMEVVVTGTVVTGTAEAGITVVTVAAGKLAPRLVLVLALDYSGVRSQLLPIMAMTTATITRPMPVHPRQRFGIGATPIRATTLTYPNARFRGGKLFSSAWVKPPGLAEA